MKYRIPGDRRNKLGAKSKQEDGIYFASTGERDRYRELKLMEKAGAIEGLLLHPRYPIIIEGKKVCDVVLDFEYYDCYRARKILIYEDYKGHQTSESKLRHKLFETLYNRKILITKAPRGRGWKRCFSKF